MACLSPNGELTESARLILTAMDQPVPLPQIAALTGLPLYRIRSAMRELSQAGFALESAAGWQTTASGRNALERVAVQL